MPETVMAVSAGWAPVALVLLGGLVVVAACLDAVLEARAGGTPPVRAVGRPVAEVARLMRQRRRTTVAADSMLWRVGGAGLVVVALLMVAVVPLGRWTLADVDAGVVWFNAMDVTVWALVWLAGWGPNSAHSLVGGYRFLAQALAYELPLMFALTAPAVAASSLRVGDFVAAQQDLWFVVWMPLAFGIYCIGVLGFSFWGPFSVAAGADIVGGVLAETSGVDRLLVLTGRYALLAAGAAFAVPVFLGGGSGPLLPGWAWVLLKTVLLLAALVSVRRQVPLLRPDRFAVAGWMVLLPAALLQVLVVSVVVAVRS